MDLMSEGQSNAARIRPISARSRRYDTTTTRSSDGIASAIARTRSSVSIAFPAYR